MITLSRIYPGIYLFFNGTLYCVLAWLFLVEPLVWFDRLRVNLLDASGYAELKTMYVGVMGALGIFFLSAALLETWRLPGVSLAVISYAGLAAVRGWEIFQDQAYNELIFQLLIIEMVDLLAGVLALYCLYLVRRQWRNPYL